MVPRSQVKSCKELGSGYSVQMVIDARDSILILDCDGVQSPAVVYTYKKFPSIRLKNKQNRGAISM
jgi:hypothetical protein